MMADGCTILHRTTVHDANRLKKRITPDLYDHRAACDGDAGQERCDQAAPVLRCRLLNPFSQLPRGVEGVIQCRGSEVPIADHCYQISRIHQQCHQRGDHHALDLQGRKAPASRIIGTVFDQPPRDVVAVAASLFGGMGWCQPVTGLVEEQSGQQGAIA